eukprot:2736913-Lingulodinium_polyedra.AAC.1
MLVKNQLRHGDTWFFVLADAGAAGKFGWPAQVVQVGGKEYFTLKAPAAVADIPFLHVYSLEGWQAMAIEWLCPLAFQ